MTQLRITKHSKKYGFKKGEIYQVTQKGTTEYVILMPDDRKHITVNDKTIKRYGILEEKKE